MMPFLGIYATECLGQIGQSVSPLPFELRPATVRSRHSMHEKVVPARCASMAFASPDGLNPEAHQHRMFLHMQKYSRGVWHHLLSTPGSRPIPAGRHCYGHRPSTQ